MKFNKRLILKMSVTFLLASAMIALIVLGALGKLSDPHAGESPEEHAEHSHEHQ